MAARCRQPGTLVAHSGAFRTCRRTLQATCRSLQVPRRVCRRAPGSALSSSLTGFRTIGKGERTVGGMPCRWIDFTGQMSGKIGLEQRLYIAVDGRTAYLITCTTAGGMWEKEQPDFEHVLDSFTIR